MQRVAARCSVLQCIAVYCSVCCSVNRSLAVLQCIALCCSVLHYVAVYKASAKGSYKPHKNAEIALETPRTPLFTYS